MRRVDWTAPAERDLEAIDDYWVQYSPARADEILARIRAAGDFLSGAPRAGPALDAGDARKWRVPSTDYLLIYRIIEKAVQILRVHHGRENWRPL